MAPRRIGVEAGGMFCHALIYLRTRLRSQSGDVGIGAVIGIALLLVAYIVYPEPFHGFVRMIIDSVLDAVRDGFGNSDKKGQGGAKDGGQLRLKVDPGPGDK